MEQPLKNKLFLLDAMALIYRAYFALNKNPRISSKGLNTSAILGFANTIYDVIKNEKPTHIAVAFDSVEPTARHEEFAAYKAHRESMPEEIGISIPYIQALIKAFRIPVLVVPGFEADDIIGTIAKKAAIDGFDVYMMTPDKDFGQLVSDHIFIYKPGKYNEKPQVIGVKDICEKYGIQNPLQVIDLLGLWGDASDNIPGIPGVGEVTARKLIASFHSVEELIKRVSEVENEKLREKIQAYTDQAIVSKRLATIILDTPVSFDSETFQLKDPDENMLRKICDELEFRTFAKRVFTDLSLKKNEQKMPVHSLQKGLFDDIVTDEPLEETTISEKKNIHNTCHSYFLTNTPVLRKSLIEMLKKASSFCFDTETTGLDPNSSELVGLSFCIKPGEAWYAPVPENYNMARELMVEFKEVFDDPSKEITGQNLKFDISMLKWYDIEINGRLFDTMMAHYLIEPDLRHNMDYLAETYLNYKPIPIEELIGKKGNNQTSMRLVDTETIKEYACEDADITMQLKNLFEPVLKETFTRKLFDEIEMPLIHVLSAMEAEGVRIDTAVLKTFSAELFKEIRIVEQQIYELAGMHFNISSPKQLGEVIYDKMRIVENPKTTKTKQYSTSEDVLVRLENKHPIIRSILDYRSLTKLKSTYVDSLPLLVNPRTGRIHTSYNQAVASTGRLSSNNPNLQNIPIRTKKGREIRKAFVPRNEKYILLSADYSQIELRIMAELSGDEGMREAFNMGMDIHTATAAKVYSLSPAEVSKEQRGKAKMVNFGIIYGISAFGLSERLNIPRKEAAEIIESYFTQYPGVKKYMENVIIAARKNGYVETMMGRRRYLRDINSANATVRGFAERNAINAPIQGSSADMIKIAMINIHQAFINEKLKSRMIMQVHDELVFDVYTQEAEVVKSIVERNMKHAFSMSVPIIVEMNTGNNWLEAH